MAKKTAITDSEKQWVEAVVKLTHGGDDSVQGRNAAEQFWYDTNRELGLRECVECGAWHRLQYDCQHEGGEPV